MIIYCHINSHLKFEIRGNVLNAIYIFNASSQNQAFGLVHFGKDMHCFNLMRTNDIKE